MARNDYFYDATGISLPVGTGVKSGDPVRVGSINGVAQTDAAPADSGIATGNTTDYASVKTDGAARLPVLTTAARAIGTPVYCTTTANAKVALTDVVGSNKWFGVLLEPITASGTSTVGVAIRQAV